MSTAEINPATRTSPFYWRDGYEQKINWSGRKKADETRIVANKEMVAGQAHELTDTPRAGYLNLAERKPPRLFDLTDLPGLAAQLHEGMTQDVARIAAGAPLPALGEGSVCDWCAARGLCRKDFWGAV